MSVTREFDLIINAGTSSPLVINANQNDSGETWLFNLYQEDGTKVTPLAGQIVGLKTDGHAIVNAGTVNGSGQVVITETAQITACPGSNIFELVFDSVHGTANFILLVEKSPVDDDADFSESDISAINQAIAMAIDSATVQAVQNGLAAETAARTSADNLLQTEIDQIIAPSGEAPSAAEVTNARIGADGTVYDTLGNAIRGQVTDLKSALTQNIEDTAEIEKTYFEEEIVDISSYLEESTFYRINNGVFEKITGMTDYTSAVIPCNVGDIFFITSVVGRASVLWMAYFCDSNKNLISAIGQGNDSTIVRHDNETVIIPPGCEYLIITSAERTSPFVYKPDFNSPLSNHVLRNDENLYSKKALDLTSYEVAGKFFRKDSYTPYAGGNYNSILMPCVGLNVFYVTEKVGATSNLALAVFYNERNAVVGYYKVGSDSGTTSYTDEKVVIPIGCTQVAFTNSGDAFPIVKTLDYTENKFDDAISGLADDIEEITEDIHEHSYRIGFVEKTIFEMNDIDVSSYTESNACYRIFNGVFEKITLPPYVSVVYPCNPGEQYFVSMRLGGSSALWMAYFCDSNKNLISAINQGSDSAGVTYNYEPVEIPDGCSYLIVTSSGSAPVIATVDYDETTIDSKVNACIPSAEIEYLDCFNGAARDSMMGTYSKLTAGNLKWTVLGDSITDTHDGHAHAGGGASDAAHGYAKIVARWLQTKFGNSLTFVNNGTGGITVGNSIPKVAEYLEGQGFDLVVVALGTNDWNVQTNLTTFESDCNDLFDEIESRTSAEIAVIGLGYFATWKPEKAIREDKYNDVLYKVSKERGYRFVSPYFEMRNAILNGGYTFADITYAPDPVHPNDAGHRIWADAAYRLFDIL